MVGDVHKKAVVVERMCQVSSLDVLSDGGKVKRDANPDGVATRDTLIERASWNINIFIEARVYNLGISQYISHKMNLKHGIFSHL